MKITDLPTEILLAIVSHIPVIDHYNIKLTGSHYLTNIVRRHAATMSRGEYLSQLHQDDTQRRYPDRRGRHPLEISLSRGSLALVEYYKRRYETARTYDTNPAPLYMRSYHVLNSGRLCTELRRSFCMAAHWAAYYGLRDAVETIADYVNLRAGTQGCTPIHYAAMGGHGEIVAVLLENGAYINALDNLGRTPLGVASREVGATAIEALTLHGASADMVDVFERSEDEWVRIYLDTQSSWQEYTVASTRYLSRKLVRRTPVLAAYEEYRALRHNNATDAGHLAWLNRRLREIAIRSGFLSIYMYALDDGGVDVDELLGERGTALYIATGSNHVRAIERLLAKGADPRVSVNKPYLGDMTPFSLACRQGHMSAVKAFLEHGFSVDFRNPNGSSPLHWATASPESPPLMDLLLEHGADVEAADGEGNTVLHAAARRNILAVEYLLAAGASCHARNNRGETPLMLGSHSVRIIRRLLAAGADLHAQDNKGCTALCHAAEAKYNGAGVLQFLASQGANIHRPDLSGRTPLHHALPIVRSDVDKIEWLLEQGADPNATALNGVPPLHLAVQREAEENVEAWMWGSSSINRNHPSPTKLLLWSGADPNARDATGLVALHLMEDFEVWRALLRSGARIDERDTEGRTLLLRLLARPTTQDSFDEFDQKAAAEFLLAHSADPNASDDRGLTPLMYAVQDESALRRALGARLVKGLLRYGADPEIKTPDGRAARDFCPSDAARSLLDNFCEKRSTLGKRYYCDVCDTKQDVDDEVYRLGMLYLAT
ncbi:ankyrin repeat-containing domain protein [Aspergillus keveii]|uniref:Ankyrin repeat-containing domain protein n=1 Tax=Aspergillus keveii TaxID=714993 RepID=A0ABR4FUT8_9EURO